MKLKTIEEKLKAYRPEAPHGDHTLNPGMIMFAAERSAAVLILLLQKEEGLTVVFTRRTEDLPSHAGQISFPGGRTSPDDADMAATALREAVEETGLEANNVRVIGFLDEYVTRSGFRVFPVVGVATEVPVWQRDVREVAEIFDVPLDYILKEGTLSERQAEDGRRYYALDWNQFHIWGATAGMLKNFIEVVTA